MGAERPLTGCGSTGTVVGPCRDLIDVGAADAGRLDPDEHLVLAQRGHRHLVEPDVAAGVPSDGPHAGRQPISAWSAIESSMSSAAIRWW